MTVPTVNPRLAKYERDVVRGKIDLGMRVLVEYADGSRRTKPVPVKETADGSIRITR